MKRKVLLCLLMTATFANIAIAGEKYWDCEVKVYGADFYGIRKSIFGSGTYKASANLEIEATSRSKAEAKADKVQISHRGEKVCNVGGINNKECKYWKESFAPPVCRPQ